MATFEDRRVLALGRRLARIYAEAEKGMTEKVETFFADFKVLDERKQALVKAGKLSQQAYDEWRRNKLLMGEKYKDLRDSIADNMYHANERAAAIINHEIPNVYAHNFNQVGQGIERKVAGYSFDLTNAETVRNLATSHKTLLPYKFVDGRRDVRWNTQKVNSQIMQGILQGESADQMSKRLMHVTTMNRESALRNARTAVTSAQNKGRVDAMKQAEDDGVIMGKEWIATKDERTRDAHLDLDRIVMPVDQPFVNSIGEIMYPGDPDADPANTYNCRCTIAEVVLGFKPKEKEKEEEPEAAEPEAAEPIAMLDTKPDAIWTPNGDYQPAESKREFMNENMRELKEHGIRSAAGANEQFENIMMQKASEIAHAVGDQEAVDTVRDNVPGSWMHGWFVEADSSFKPKLEDAILGNPEVLNAGWNIAYRDYLETVGADSGKTFEEFLYTPMTMFRGTRGQAEIASDVWSSFSMDRKIAESFGDKIEEIMIRPIDTWGAYQTTAEAEILVPARMLRELRGV